MSGLAAKDPAFGTPAVWIEPGVREQAEMFGYTVVESGSVIATHLTETVRRHADEIITRDAAKHLIDELKRTSPTVVDELIPGRDEAGRGAANPANAASRRRADPAVGGDPGDAGRLRPRTRDPILLTEYVRHRLARTICNRYRNSDNRLYVVTLDPALEDRIRAGFDHNEKGMLIRMSPQAVEMTCRLIAASVERLTMANHPPVVLVSPPIRAALKQMTSPHLPQLAVLSYNEITRDTKIESVAMVSDVK